MNIKEICLATNISSLSRYTRIVAISLLFSIGLISGCATAIKQEPFAKFAESAENLRDGTDKAVDIIIPQNVVRYKRDLLIELSTKKPPKLILLSRLELKEGDLFGFESVPRYMVFDEFKSGLRAMTDSMYIYSVLLRDFANETIQSNDEFSKFTADLNTNAFEAVRIIDKSVSQNSADNIGLISTAAAAAFNNYLKTQQKEALLEAIEKNQLTIEQFTDKVKRAISIIALASSKEYSDSSNALILQMGEQHKRSAAIDELILLNREFYAQSQVLKLLNASVDKFPAAHNELKTATKNPERSLAHIVELVNRGNQLKALAKNAQKANSNKLLEADALQVESKAISLEADAKLALLDAANARAEAVISRIEANADSSDMQKETKAKGLADRAIQLKDISDNKAATAKLMRDAAEAVKSSIQALTS